MKDKVKMAVVIVLALLLAMLAGIMVTRASAPDGSVLWKQHCPVYADVDLVHDKTGTLVFCVLGAEAK